MLSITQRVPVRLRQHQPRIRTKKHLDLHKMLGDIQEHFKKGVTPVNLSPIIPASLGV